MSQPLSNPPYSTLATVARCIARSLEAEYGIAPQPVLESVGMDIRLLQDDEQRLPLTDLSQLWLRCVELTGEEHFGLRIARYLAPADLYGIDLALYASASLGEAAQRFAQFLDLLTTATQGRIQRNADGDWVLSYQVRRASEPTPAAKDFFIYSQIFMFERQSQLAARQFMRSLELTRPRPADLAPWEALGVPTSFEHPFASMVFRADAWEKPMLGANPHLLAQVEQPILGYLARLGAPLPLSALRARLVESLSEPPTAEQFAASLGITPESLQNSLLQQHASFTQLLDQTRQARTLQLLAMPELTLDQVCEQVGFSKSSSLIRAFRRWQGTTPLGYRKSLFSESENAPS